MTTDTVNPARAGMIPASERDRHRRSSKPRASGDDPAPLSVTSPSLS